MPQTNSIKSKLNATHKRRRHRSLDIHSNFSLNKKSSNENQSSKGTQSSKGSKAYKGPKVALIESIVNKVNDLQDRNQECLLLTKPPKLIGGVYDGTKMEDKIKDCKKLYDDYQSIKDFYKNKNV